MMGKLDAALGNADFREDTVASAAEYNPAALPEPHRECGGVSVRYVPLMMESDQNSIR